MARAVIALPSIARVCSFAIPRLQEGHGQYADLSAPPLRCHRQYAILRKDAAKPLISKEKLIVEHQGCPLEA